MPRPLFTPEKDPVPIVQAAGWAPGPVWTGAVNLAPTGIRSPDRPSRDYLRSYIPIQEAMKLEDVKHTAMYRFSHFAQNYACAIL